MGFWDFSLIFNLGGVAREFCFFFIFLELFCSMFVMFFLLLCLLLAERHTFSSLVYAGPHHFGPYFPFICMPSCPAPHDTQRSRPATKCVILWGVSVCSVFIFRELQGIRWLLVFSCWFCRPGRTLRLGGCGPTAESLCLSLSHTHTHTHTCRTAAYRVAHR